MGVLSCGGAASGPIDHPRGATELVLRSDTGGGLVPREVLVGALPGFSLYGDGTMIALGGLREIYPPPAMPNLLSSTVTEEGMQRILVAARDAGLFSVRDYGTPGIADGATTTFTVVADGNRSINEIYALGYGDPGSDPRLTEEQVGAREAALGFSTKLGDLPGFLGSEVGLTAPYDYRSLAVFSRLVEPDQMGDAGGVTPNRLTWPLEDLTKVAVDQSGLGRIVVTGQDLATLRPLLDQATQITLWSSGGRFYRLIFRPLLPDEA